MQPKNSRRVPRIPRQTLARVALVIMRTLIGWHFLYEGLYKLLLPGWSRAGQPLTGWTAAGYLTQAGGPLGPLLHRLAQPPLIGWIDILVPLGLALVGLSLILGLFTQLGCWAALGFLVIFYVSAIPTSGLPQPGAEGSYLLVNKNLIEVSAVLVLIAFQTGRIAGLDVLRARRAAALPATVVAEPDGKTR
jgi:thiosulfate dehydrogenase [quinone] large subunit